VVLTYVLTMACLWYLEYLMTRLMVKSRKVKQKYEL